MKVRVKLFRPDGVGTGTFFLLPFDVEQAFGKKRAPIVVTIGGVTYRTTVAVYGGKYHVVMRGELQRQAGVSPGDVVTATIEADLAQRVVTLPQDMKARLARSAHAKAVWAGLSYSHQKEHVDWLTSAKKDETRKKRLAQWIAALEKMTPRATRKKKAAPRTVRRATSRKRT